MYEYRIEDIIVKKMEDLLQSVDWVGGGSLMVFGCRRRGQTVDGSEPAGGKFGSWLRFSISFQVQISS